MSAQLLLTDDLAPRRKAMHIVHSRKQPPVAEGLELPWGTKAASVFEIPWPTIPEDRERIYRKHVSHYCALYGGHRYRCIGSERCSLRDKAPCAECERRVRLSYRAGKYVSR